jgi:hypothetical protein
MGRRHFVFTEALVVVAAGLVLSSCSSGNDSVDKTPSAKQTQALTRVFLSDTAPRGRRVGDESGAVTLETPRSWSTGKDFYAENLFDAKLVASDDVAQYLTSWDPAGVAIGLSRRLGTQVGTSPPDSSTLVKVFADLSPRDDLQAACAEPSTSAITSTGTDALSSALGGTFSTGIAETYTNCGDNDATFIDLVATSEEEAMLLYMQLQFVGPEDHAAVNRALATLEFDLAKVPGRATPSTNPADDVTINECAPPPSLLTPWVQIGGLVTNHSSQRSTYTFAVSVEDPTGKRLSTSNDVLEQDLEPNQTAQWTTNTILTREGPIQCRLIGFSRVAS